MSASSSPGRDRQREIVAAGIRGRRPAVPTDFATLERRARRKASARAWSFVAGGAGEGATMRANREAFERWRIVPRMLRGAADRDISIELLGRRIPAPILLAPVGALELLHPEADLAVARAAAALGIPYIFTSQASVPMEACAAAMGGAPRWFQLYWGTDDALAESFVERARAAGAEALVVTLDATTMGWRPTDLNRGVLPAARGEGLAQYTTDVRFLELVRERIAATAASGALPREFTARALRDELAPRALRTLVSVSRRFPGRLRDNLRSPEPRAAVRTFFELSTRPSLSWADIERLRERTELPILLKGILHPDDARRALAAGVAGVIVSNHGGRQIDGAIGALDALVEIAPVVAGQAALLVDGGVRGGADVFKALALGADAVLVGRPYAYGLALAGAAGVREVLANIVAEFDLTLGLSGLASVAELGPDAVRRT